jgi:hypothetical protein
VSCSNSVTTTCLHALVPLPTPQDGETTLHYAAWYGSVDVVNALLGRGANVTTVDSVSNPFYTFHLPKCVEEDGPHKP